MTVRRTQSIVTDSSSADPVKEADVVMTAATLGFAADYIGANRTPLQLDMDPLDAVDTAKTELFTGVVARIDEAVARYLVRTGQLSGNVIPGLSPGHREGAMIMGVYVLAGQSRPTPREATPAPRCSPRPSPGRDGRCGNRSRPCPRRCANTPDVARTPALSTTTTPSATPIRSVRDRPSAWSPRPPRAGSKTCSADFSGVGARADRRRRR